MLRRMSSAGVLNLGGRGGTSLDSLLSSEVLPTLIWRWCLRFLAALSTEGQERAGHEFVRSILRGRGGGMEWSPIVSSEELDSKKKCTVFIMLDCVCSLEKLVNVDEKRQMCTERFYGKEGREVPNHNGWMLE